MDYYGYTVYENGDIMGLRGWMLKPSLHRPLKKYLRVSLVIEGKATTLFVHRLVALCYIPNPDNKPEVDHILSREKTNNNVSNLRWATKSENGINRELDINNTSGVKGVSRHRHNSWMAYLTINGKRITKTFSTFEKAVAKRQEWELEHFCL